MIFSKLEISLAISCIVIIVGAASFVTLQAKKAEAPPIVSLWDRPNQPLMLKPAHTPSDTLRLERLKWVDKCITATNQNANAILKGDPDIIKECTDAGFRLFPKEG